VYASVGESKAWGVRATAAKFGTGVSARRRSAHHRRWYVDPEARQAMLLVAENYVKLA
jgi:hypothetical protein